MSEGPESFESWCRDEFSHVRTMLSRLDEAIRGNGKKGILIRMDRLEMARALQSKVLWVGVGCGLTVTLKVVWEMISFG